MPSPNAASPGGPSLRSGYLWAGLTVMIWSGFILMSRFGGKSPLTGWDITALRFGTAALVLLPVWLRHRRDLHFNLQTLVLALTGGAGFGMLVYSGFKFSSAAHAAILLPGMLPFAVSLMAWLILGERPGSQRWAGLTIIGGGLVCLGMDSFQDGLGHWQGDLLLLSGSFSWALYTALVRRWQVSPWDATLGVALVSAALYMPVYLLWLPKQISQVSWGFLAFQAAYHGIIVVIVAMLFYMRAMVILGPTRVGTLMALVPAIAGLASAPLLGEALSPLILLGLGLVSGGAWFGSLTRIPFIRRSPCPT